MGGTTSTALAVCLFCAVAGYHSWPVSMIAATAMLAIIMRTRRIGTEFVLSLLLFVGAAIRVPNLVWWSWTDVDSVSTVFHG